MSSELRNRKNSIVPPKDVDSDIDIEDEEFKEIIKDIESDHWKDEAVTPTRWTKTKTSLREWGLSCSWHGVPHMAQSVSPATILLWTTLVAISAVLFVYLITITVKQYFSFPKTVKLNVCPEMWAEPKHF
uniref:Uncharacterized protein n=1 Tax=Caenorhabditis japonica TaxID=281687 RepID=A0A8R1E5B4_CAEJA